MKGMAPINCDRKSSLEDYGVDMDSVYAVTGPFARIGKSKDPNLWDQFNATEIHNNLRCTQNQSHWLVSRELYCKDKNCIRYFWYLFVQVIKSFIVNFSYKNNLIHAVLWNNAIMHTNNTRAIYGQVQVIELD